MGARKGHLDAPVSWDSILKGFCEDGCEHVPTSSDVSAARKCQIRSHLNGNFVT
jgi:hypothetical protein